MSALMKGDVFASGSDRKLRIVEMVNESRARCLPLSGPVSVAVEGDSYKLTNFDACENFSPNAEVEVLERRGETGLLEFLRLRSSGRRDKDPLEEQQQNERENDMLKTNKIPRGGLAAAALQSTEPKKRGRPPGSGKKPAAKKEPACPGGPQGESDSAKKPEAAKGRAAHIGALVAAGKPDAEIIASACEMFPNTTKAVCERIIARKRK